MNATIIINGHTLHDGDLGPWQQRPPEWMTQYLTPGATPRPVMTAVLVTLAQAATRNQALCINAADHNQGFTLKVDYHT